MTDLPPSRRRVLRAALALSTTLPLAVRAQVSEWEFFEVRPREFSLTRRPPPPAMAIEFSGQRLPSDARWDRLSDAERQVVRQAQPGPLAEGDDPPYPRLGLKPLIDRLHVVRGPVRQPLRVYLEIDAYGAPQRVAIGGPVSDTFSRQMLSLMKDAAFKPGTCDGKACTRVFAMDLVYLGEAG